MPISKREVELKRLLRQVDRFASKVEPIYALLGWEWSSCAGIPKKSDIAKTLQDLVYDIIADKSCEYCETGGLRVSIHKDGDNTWAEMAMVIRRCP